MTVQTYVKKPVKIRAVRYEEDGSNLEECLRFLAGTNSGALPPTQEGVRYIIVATLEGQMQADPGDWLVQGVEGEFYPVKPSIFAKTYDLVMKPEDFVDGMDEDIEEAEVVEDGLLPAAE